MKKISVKINGKTVSCLPNQTILEVAQQNGFDIPTLCFHKDFKPKGNCRVCVVEVKGQNSLMASCKTKVADGMVILTDSEKVRRARNINIEMVFAEHIEKCPTCVWNFNCPLLDMARKYKVNIKRFPERKKVRKIYKFGNAVEIDGTQCIDCRNCLEACSVMQNINYLEMKKKGYQQEVVPTSNTKIDCIYCGQCALHCPIGAAQEQTEWEKVEKELKNKNKIVVAQFAPSIRVSIGEEFGWPYGKIATGQIAAGLKELGFQHVFDVNFGADITTMVEAVELLERVSKKGVMPMITSCCPAWVKYAEFYHPEILPHLTTARSPHIHLGGVIKTFWAQENKISAKNIVVVSIMPCTAKKYEKSRSELKIKGNSPVDYVLTTREFAFLLKRHGIDLAKLKPQKSDTVLNNYSGAAAIYGGSGGVMESALRTAQGLACQGKKASVCPVRIDFKKVRGLEHVKEATVDVAGKKMKIAVVNGIGNVEPVLENLHKYDYIEVMACPGGCIGGGGQPIPTTDQIRQKRMDALYSLDKNSKIRKAHENKEVSEVLQWLNEEELEHRVLHTSYKRKRRGK